MKILPPSETLELSERSIMWHYLDLQVRKESRSSSRNAREDDIYVPVAILTHGPTRAQALV